MKAYALTELGKLNEAREALESAIALSPMNSQYLSELGYTYQAMKDCDKSIEMYAQAASMAELASDYATKMTDLSRAWRGAGVLLGRTGKARGSGSHVPKEPGIGSEGREVKR
jgi:tetratricopeptide (TPR) repeat protein